jgi:hypothetical protein
MTSAVPVRWQRPVSHRLISDALWARNVSLKQLQVIARQRNEEKRARCRRALNLMGVAGMAKDFVIIDESHVGDRDRRRRRGWSVVNTPAHVYEWFSGDSTLRSLLCAMDQHGFVIDACKLVSVTPTALAIAVRCCAT